MIRKRGKIAHGQRIYAVGDIHGRFDLFTALISKIRVDAAWHRAPKTKVILLGDLVDRGPASREVVDYVQRLVERSANLIALRGNHEQVMVRAVGGDRKAFEAWLKMGGIETLTSWGIEASSFKGPVDELLELAQRTIPTHTLTWMKGLPLYYRSGGVLFVHAGIRPQVPIREQDTNDFMWIRSDFIKSNVKHSDMIVHGHTVCEHGPEILWNRINVDTGAYRTNRLSAVAFQGSHRWTLTASSPHYPDDNLTMSKVRD